ncbi:4-hydroxy-tetrahydrodipicolinate synthase [Calditerrivibrio nitroreducens]|uniref:4-hydroxy-tetrahydrodipicolinate synthase n=1 Tax=Calditerrivibrio nitroreducens (strain DSM 19672 / NBRC 101217 / Yu37-1) TaxID=768670 RepID=E4TGK3_CALNY|nr:4-hydroxy-tetrahydrodipicolinate synthase [Calditerrivibrio nitroreducens]ADR19716.1 dihydrodipicolinate synthase [Calditerrivibrio nitroreducens DSM 19672]
MFKGAITALVTPMKDGMVDEEKLRNLVDFQINNGISALVPCGTTGEAATLSYEEHMRVIEIVVEQSNKRVPVIAGTGSNSTHETIYLTEFAKKVGCDAALVVTPYYNKPTQKGLYEHFKAVADAVDIPIVLYNVPGRTSVNMLPDTVIKLSKIKNIVAVKEASGSLDQVSEIIAGVSPDFDVLSGDDSLTIPMMALGAKGVISVASNIIPKEVSQMVDLWLKGDIASARDLHLKLFPLFKGIFIETNPIPVKKALYLMGIIENDIRLPLVEMTPEGTEKLRKILVDLNVKLVR